MASGSFGKSDAIFLTMSAGNESPSVLIVLRPNLVVDKVADRENAHLQGAALHLAQGNSLLVRLLVTSNFSFSIMRYSEREFSSASMPPPNGAGHRTKTSTPNCHRVGPVERLVHASDFEADADLGLMYCRFYAPGSQCGCKPNTGNRHQIPDSGSAMPNISQELSIVSPMALT